MARADARRLRASLAGYVRTVVQLLRWQVVLAVGLVLVASAAEGVGILILIPVLDAAGLDMGSGAVSTLTGIVSRGFALLGLSPSVPVALAAFLTVSGLRVFLTRWRTLVSVRLEQQLALDLRRQVYAAVLGADWATVSRMRASGITHVLTSEIERAGAITPMLVTLLAGMTLGLMYLVIAIQLSLVLTVFVVIGGLSLMTVLWARTRRSHLVGQRLSRRVSAFYEAAIQHLGALRTVKSYGREERNLQLFSEAAREIADTGLAAARVHADARAWFDIGTMAFLCAVILVAVRYGGMSGATLLVLLLVYARLAPRMMLVRQQIQVVLGHLPAFDSTTHLLQRCKSATSTETGDSGPVRFRDRVRMDGVRFRYDAEGPDVLADLDLEIEHGSLTAVVGLSGAGKSTMADILMGLLVPSAGRLLIDGQPLQPEAGQAWRHQIGYVSPDTFLFHDTIRANLRWARPEASEAEMLETLELASAGDFVRALPDGLDTVIGEMGVRLSGGERQRLALARALLRRPSLIILDEATSALDAEHERRILLALDELRGTVTIVMVAHRLSSVRGADLIYVLDAGRLVESGTWDTLVSKPGGRLRGWCDMQGLERTERITQPHA